MHVANYTLEMIETVLDCNHFSLNAKHFLQKMVRQLALDWEGISPVLI